MKLRKTATIPFVQVSTKKRFVQKDLRSTRNSWGIAPAIRKEAVVKKDDVEWPKMELRCSIRSFFLHFPQNGKDSGGEYAVWSLSGEPENNPKTCLTAQN
jgi:hypothetical protein